LDIIIGIFAFFIVLPILCWIGPYCFRAWRWLPHFLQYILFLPVSFVLSGLAAAFVAILFFRDVIFIDHKNNFWLDYVIPVTAPVFSFVLFSIFIIWLCPHHEKKAAKAVLFLMAAANVLAWAFIGFNSRFIEGPFWTENAVVEALASVVTLITVGVLWKKLDGFHEAVRGVVDEID
jgi:hypothetical protein